MIGGGNSGVEEGLFLAQFAERIRLVEFMPELGVPARLREIVRSNPKVHDPYEHRGRRVPSGSDRQARERRGPRSGDGSRDEVSTGGGVRVHRARPNTAFLRDSLELDPRGFIVAGEDHATSMPGVFAAGDVRARSTKQLVSATGEGASALLAVRRYLDRSELQLAAVG